MDRRQLATLLSWAGESGLRGRKRLQKVVFFLQDAGCPVDCRYTLHHFGPYSADVADACDEMVAAALVDETGGPQSGEKQYCYLLKPKIAAVLREQTPDSRMQPFQELGQRLLCEDIWPLELGSTILFFYRRGCDWHQALTKACQFKNTPLDCEPSRQALQLAKEVAAQAISV